MNTQHPHITNADPDRPGHQVRPTLTQSDQDSPTLTDPVHVASEWITLDQVATLFAAEGLQRTRRVLARYCQTERLIAKKDAGPNGDEWFVDPVSVPRAIAELKMIHRKPDVDTPVSDSPSLSESDQDSPSQTRTVLDKNAGGEENPTKQGLPDPDGDPAQPRPTLTQTLTDPDAVRPGQTETVLDIFNHPHVKRLERDIDEWKEEARQWKDEYKRQVETTRQIQTQSFDKLIELQRLVQVGQSKTLADFFLKTKDWLLGAAPDAPDRSAHDDDTDGKK